MVVPRIAAAPALALVLLLGGCLRAEEDAPVGAPQPDEASPSDGAPRSGDAPAPAPDGSNATEPGIAGRSHAHDYWGARDAVVVFDGTVTLQPPPLAPDGDRVRSVAIVKIPAPLLVFEGTDRVTVRAASPAYPTGALVPSPAHPAPPSLAISWRTAADAEWRPEAALAYDRDVEIAVAPREADVPHAAASLWVFRLAAPGADRVDARLTVTTHRGRAVAEWPGHPDFYAHAASRVVFEGRVTTHVGGAEERLVFDAREAWTSPIGLVSHGTARLDVFANVTRVTTIAPPTAFLLEHHNATDVGVERKSWPIARAADGSPDGRALAFTVPVDAAGMDGPYQPSSRWGLRLVAGFGPASGPAASYDRLCQGCVAYELEYDLRVLAVAIEGSGRAMD